MQRIHIRALPESSPSEGRVMNHLEIDGVVRTHTFTDDDKRPVQIAMPALFVPHTQTPNHALRNGKR
jgi:hypothetical protein